MPVCVMLIASANTLVLKYDFLHHPIAFHSPTNKAPPEYQKFLGT